MSLARGLLVLLLALTALACGRDLQFKRDDRIEVQHPENFAEVKEPVTVRWTARDFDPQTDGSFLVFVDRAPMPPGQTIEYFNRRNRDNIIASDRPQVTIEVLESRPAAPTVEQNRHFVTIVLVDTEGRRIGETSGSVEFDVIKKPISTGPVG